MIKLTRIEEEYLRSFTLEQPSDADRQPKSSSLDAGKRLKATIKEGALSTDNIPLMHEREQAEIAFSKILPHAKELNKKLTQEKEPVLDPYSWQDLHLIAGNSTTPDKNALNYIKKTRTAMGSCVMATQMVNPTTNLQEIASKQKVTKTLLDNAAIAEELDESMQIIEKDEALGLSLWQEDNQLTHKEYKKELDSFYYRRFGLQNKNTSTGLLQTKKVWKDLWLHPILGFSIITCLIYTLFWGLTNPIYKLSAYIAKSNANSAEYKFLLSKIRHSLGTHLAFFFLWDMIVPFISLVSIQEVADPNNLKQVKKIWRFQHYYDLLKSNSNIYAKITLLVLVLGKILLGVYFVYKAYRKYWRNQSMLQFLADHLAPVQALIIQARKISKLVASHPVLEKHYSQYLSATRSLLATSEKPTSDVALLIHQLEKIKLDNRSYFFSNTGRLLATYQLFQKNKEALADIYYEMGLADAQLSIYKLMRDARNHDSDNQFVLGKLEVSPNHLPKLTMQKMWHFGLDPQKAVSNDVQLDSQAGPRTTIITGPNAGGKSTYILGIGLNSILNQVYGIVAAQSAIQTIFHKIITYVNPVQNLAAGLSLAEAGMEVLKAHKKIFDEVKKPILAIIDEILNGTDPTVAADYSYKILTHRNETYTNCLTLLTTHFMKLTQLAEKNPLTKNQKVVVTIPGTHGKKFDYTYRIEAGITDQNIVKDMLTEKGII